ncbi:TetR/AcrR family transcriptional regulator [Murimonas intestini]|mgnify:CR=1 FL=1|uniref:TetR family transcriptional regulator n=1 Tax=Murimonas intestini TaxID=1337051 RepID=A0AB73T893_9FIRM|nr:TetR/AcrR family transcriptional regulator [Murimonas intestini]MCR1839892.1 TetR/AcrR family transcriptional regulator [Murimonas intestini]MCR1866733.1 TetR/AcrR family transcriptional regulator [Murimonas intestini]MCR1883566.1 TetR/AcrR family transcriptional regulator [Murimonas intestini]
MARNKHPEETVSRILDTAQKLFFEKGYEKTTIQDIINKLGNLSKGAIYHHFGSKEEIVDAVINRLFEDQESKVEDLINDKGMTGLEKLQKLFLLLLNNPEQERVLRAIPDIMHNPKVFTMQMMESMDHVAPQILEPIIRQGIEDGSIKTEYPKELAQVLVILCNIWMNPVVFTMDEEELQRRFLFIKDMMERMGIPVVSNEVLYKVEYYRKILAQSKG